MRVSETFSRAMDAMADDHFQGPTYPGYAPFDSCLDEPATFNLTTDTMAGDTFNTIHNPIFPDSLAYESYFGGPMALNTLVDGTMADTSLDILPTQVLPCDSYVDEQMTHNIEADIQAFPDYIMGECDGNAPLAFEMATSNVADDSFDIDEPTTRGFQKWKESWDEKMLLVNWKRRGKSWDDITKSFQKMKTRKGNTRKSMLHRADSEIEALGKAAAADRDGEADRLRDLALSQLLGDALRVDYDGLWDRISESMSNCGGEMKWSPHRVKYAWNHGVSNLFPHILLRQRRLIKVVLT